MIAARAFHRARPTAGRSTLLLAGLAAAVLARTVLNGDGAPSAFLAGAAFGAGLIGIAGWAGWQARRPGLGAVGLGVAGGLVLVMLPVIARPGPGPSLGIHPEPFLAWAAVTVLVAVGEESVLRGVLFDALRAAMGSPAAVALTSVAFALLHVPLYGWHVVPLDLAVGVWLGGLRLVSRGMAAPAIAHAAADLATWFL